MFAISLILSTESMTSSKEEQRECCVRSDGYPVFLYYAMLMRFSKDLLFNLFLKHFSKDEQWLHTAYIKKVDPISHQLDSHDLDRQKVYMCLFKDYTKMYNVHCRLDPVLLLEKHEQRQCSCISADAESQLLQLISAAKASLSLHTVKRT